MEEAAMDNRIEVFTVRRRLDAGVDRVFEAFVDPVRLEHWFIVDPSTKG
jgi:uncharacterized protein YndB with AHSA1/START domain